MDKALGFKLKIANQAGEQLKAQMTAEGAVMRVRLGAVRVKEDNFAAVLHKLSSTRRTELPRLLTHMTSFATERQEIAAMRGQLSQLAVRLQKEEARAEKLESKLSSLKAIRENQKEAEELDEIGQLAAMQGRSTQQFIMIESVTSKIEAKAVNELSIQVSAVRSPERAVEKINDPAASAVTVDYRVGDKTAEVQLREINGRVAVEVGTNSTQLRERFQRHKPEMEDILRGAEVPLADFKITSI